MNVPLKQGQELLATVIDAVPVPVLAIDRQCTVLLANRAAQTMMPEAPRQAVAARCYEFFGQGCRPCLGSDDGRCPMEQVIASRSAVVVEQTFRDRQGRERLLEVRATPLFDAAGAVSGIVESFHDVTETRRAGAALQASEERLRLVLDASRTGWFQRDAIRDTLVWDEQCKALFGLPPDVVIDFPRFLALIHPDDRQRIFAGMNAHYADGALQFENEFRVVWPDGSLHWLMCRGRIERDAQGRGLGSSGVTIDITDRKLAEERLAQERNILRTLIDHLPDYIFIKDRDSRFVVANQAVAEAMGSTPEELEGKTDREFYPERLTREFLGDEQRVLRSGEPMLNKDEPHVLPNGEVRAVLTTKMPLRDGQGRIVGLVGIGRDITELRHAVEALRRAHDELEVRVQQRTAELARANAELVQAKEAAEAASRAKSAFLANMSHEIRTPLNAVIGMTELMLEGPLNGQQHERLAAVHDAGQILLTLLNDILDFSRIEAGKLRLAAEPFDLRESLGDTLKLFALRAFQQGLELVLHVHADAPATLVGDFGRLRQVLMNLVGNALKFTDRGEIVVEVGVDARTADTAELHFRVRDTGIGIPPDRQAAIFEMFEQADNSMRRRHGGAGLGLTIASGLVTLMHGRIWVESQPGQGSCFHFTARLGLPADADPPPGPEALAGLRALLVDDNGASRGMLAETLGAWRCDVDTAASAAEAQGKLLQDCRDERPPALVLIDAHLAQGDGAELIAWVRQQPGLAGCKPILMTSGDRPTALAAGERAGVTAVLTKPITPSELEAAAQIALGLLMPATPATPLGLAAGEARTELRVLLVEDSLVNQKLAVALLESRGHRVRVAGNGREALAILAQNAFDLILMDVQMPEMDGLEATARIRAEGKRSGGHVPIVAMTAHALSDDRQMCLDAGMDDYLAKPIRPTALFQAIQRAVAGAGAPLAAEEAAAIDWDQALGAVQGVPAALTALVQAAEMEIPQLLKQLDAALAAGDANRLRLTAHTLKGSLGYFGKGAVWSQVAELEGLAKQGNLEAAAGAVAGLQKPLVQFLAALRGHDS